MEYPWLSMGTMAFLSEGVTKARGLREEALNRLHSEERFQIPVEKISAPMLLQSAKQDNLWPSHKMSLSILERLKAKKPNMNSPTSPKSLITT